LFALIPNYFAKANTPHEGPAADLILAKRHEWSAALVVFFAPTFDGIGPRGSVPAAQIHHGSSDTGPTDFANAAKIKGLLKLEGPDVAVLEYKDATHGFAGPTPADKKAAADSKAATVKVFETRL